MERGDAFPVSDAAIAARAAAEQPLLGGDGAEIDALRRWAATAPPVAVEGARFVFFVGYPRSGHSLVGALLDAHPEIAIAHELDVLRFMLDGFRRRAILALLQESAARHARIGKRWGPHDYRVPGQWQGRVRRIAAIGDKKGGATTTRIAAQPAALDRMIAEMAMPARAIHVVRHPLDNVTTIASRHYPDAIDPLEPAIRRYAGLARANAAILRRLGERAITVHHEDMVADPRQTLRALAAFLGVEAPTDWLDAAAGTVSPAPRRSREGAGWSDERLGEVRRLIEEIGFLGRYALDR